MIANTYLGSFVIGRKTTYSTKKISFAADFHGRSSSSSVRHKKSNLAHKKLMKSEKIMKGFHILISVIVDLTSIEYCVSLVSYVMQ